jgi:hypothetical protein
MPYTNKLEITKLIGTLKTNMLEFVNKNLDKKLNALNLPTKKDVEKLYKDLTKKYEHELGSLKVKYSKEITQVQNIINDLSKKFSLPIHVNINTQAKKTNKKKTTKSTQKIYTKKIAKQTEPLHTSQESEPKTTL